MEPWGTPMCDFQFTSHLHPTRWFQSVNFPTFSCSSASTSPPISITAFASFLHARLSSFPSFSLLLLSVSVAVPHHPSLAVFLFIFWSLLLKSCCWCSCHGDYWWKDEGSVAGGENQQKSAAPEGLADSLISWLQFRDGDVQSQCFSDRNPKCVCFLLTVAHFSVSAQSEMKKRTLDACKWVWPSSEQGHAALILGKTYVTETLTEKKRRVHVYRFVSAR